MTADGAKIDATYDASTGYVQYTTSGSDIQISLTGANHSDPLGLTEKLFLKDNYQWAGSHGFDDNIFLSPSIKLFQEKDWRATLYLVTSEIDNTRDEHWRTDTPIIHRLLTDGWSIGSHAWLTSCNDAERVYLDQSFTRLDEIIASSSVPDYKVISFAAPCMISDYHPLILEIKASGTADVLFNESDGEYFHLLDQQASTLVDQGHRAVPLNLNLWTGRGQHGLGRPSR